ncbi:MAG: hypothetical protein K2O44_01615 [Clostridia bacterium]|nr:hypothetical protein [Clostridia bacterium]
MKRAISRVYSLFAIIALMILMTVGFTACINSYVAKLSHNWGIDLPKSMNLVYSCKNVGFGDGFYLYVYETEFDSLEIEFVPVDEEKAAVIDKACDTMLKDLDDDYYINWEHDCFYFYQSKNSGRDYIYLIYDKDNSTLYVCENIM